MNRCTIIAVISGVFTAVFSGALAYLVMQSMQSDAVELGKMTWLIPVNIGSAIGLCVGNISLKFNSDQAKE